MHKILSRTLSAVLVLLISLYFVLFIASGSVLAAPEAIVDSTNPWETGGQITMTLKGCDGYSTITVKADFGGKVTDASGWGFDTYQVDGSVVTATVSKDGPNSWGFNGNVGIQVNGSGIKEIKLISIQGDNDEGKVSTGTGAKDQQDKKPDKPDNKPNDNKPAPGVVNDTSDNKKGKKGDDWLTTDGSKIVDKNGTEVWLTGVNWFGYNTGTNIFDGCWSCSMEGALKAIADRGFNLLRIPMSAELLLEWKNGNFPNANFNQANNPDLVGLNSLEIFDRALEICEANGIKVMIDIHSANTDASGHNAPLWYTDKISASQYLEALDWVSKRYKDNDTIVAYDLKNEPHGAGNEQQRAIWNDSNDENNWKHMAELAGNTILDNNPNALIVIEGNQIFPKEPSSNNFTSMNEDDYYNSWWGGNLMGVKYYPVDFGSKERNKQIVYSPHDYGPAVYQQPWFHDGFNYESLKKEYWNDYWLYIVTENKAPILIGEWGGFMSGDNLTWMTYIRQLIGEYRLNYTFWCFNADSGDTGGLVLDDFTTWDEEKYGFVSEVIWKDSNGKAIGLDHEIKLGQGGTSIGEFSKVEPAKPDPKPDDKKPDPKPEDKKPEDKKPEDKKPETQPTETTVAATEQTTAATEGTTAAPSETTAVTETSASETVETLPDMSEDMGGLNGNEKSDDTEETGLNDALYEITRTPTRKKAEPIKLTGFMGVLKGIAITAIVIVFGVVVYMVARTMYLRRLGYNFKEILIYMFRKRG